MLPASFPLVIRIRIIISSCLIMQPDRVSGFNEQLIAVSVHGEACVQCKLLCSLECTSLTLAY